MKPAQESPRTDALIQEQAERRVNTGVKLGSDLSDVCDHARRLERELSEAREWADTAQVARQELIERIKELELALVWAKRSRDGYRALLNMPSEPMSEVVRRCIRSTGREFEEGFRCDAKPERARDEARRFAQHQHYMAGAHVVQLSASEWSVRWFSAD